MPFQLFQLVFEIIVSQTGGNITPWFLSKIPYFPSLLVTVPCCATARGESEDNSNMRANKRMIIKILFKKCRGILLGLCLCKQNHRHYLFHVKIVSAYAIIVQRQNVIVVGNVAYLSSFRAVFVTFKGGG